MMWVAASAAGAACSRIRYEWMYFQVSYKLVTKYTLSHLPLHLPNPISKLHDRRYYKPLNQSAAKTAHLKSNGMEKKS